ncbi:hypothetical protein OQ252_12665 [Acetobacter farinalis]|uniref:Uncharacterized protein n=1 Tax=Acetobacter farinalis TaxID=1260984 RepID=A0ABT3QAE1_9PROT|nr:hypothetical protein [Acetobacter farinalis]MCX2562240.1 hypothetical protein [Acetobacter farinalis]NHO30857.1 hypothetical protein [Acetobacter farinalis]
MRLDIERLRKIWALAERGIAGEATAAKARALSMASPFGYDLDDIPVLLRGGDVEQARKDRERLRAEAERRAQEAARKAELKARRQTDREKADEIERRYGGNLFQPSADERALIDAAAPYLKRDSRFEHDWNRDAIDTLRAAFPLPTTISDAIAEWKRWNALCSDRQFVCRARRKGVWESQEPVQHRMQIVADIAGHELPASTLDDLITRLRFLEELEPDDAGIHAILRDLTTLQIGNRVDTGARTTPEVPPRPRRRKTRTATERRAEVEAILASEEGRRMTLRQVADMVGVSPATVLNLKRKIEGSLPDTNI